MEQIKILKKLMKIAKTSPKTFMPAILKEFKKNFYLKKTTPNGKENLELCEKNIKEQLITNLVGKVTVNPQFLEISSLPIKLVGLIKNSLRKHH